MKRTPVRLTNQIQTRLPFKVLPWVTSGRYIRHDGAFVTREQNLASKDPTLRHERPSKINPKFHFKTRHRTTLLSVHTSRQNRSTWKRLITTVPFHTEIVGRHASNHACFPRHHGDKIDLGRSQPLSQRRPPTEHHQAKS